MSGADSIVYNRASMEDARAALAKLAEIIMQQLDYMMQQAVAWRNHPDTSGAMAAAAEMAIAAIKETQQDITDFMNVVGTNVADSGEEINALDGHLANTLHA
jgi:hypothetical protein